MYFKELDSLKDVLWRWHVFGKDADGILAIQPVTGRMPLPRHWFLDQLAAGSVLPGIQAPHRRGPLPSHSRLAQFATQTQLRHQLLVAPRLAGAPGGKSMSRRAAERLLRRLGPLAVQPPARGESVRWRAPLILAGCSRRFYSRPIDFGDTASCLASGLWGGSNQSQRCTDRGNID